MQEIVLAISVFAVLTSIFIWSKAAGTLNFANLNMISWPFYQLYLITFLAIPLAANLDLGDLTQASKNFYNNPSTLIFVWASILWMYISMPLGSLAVIFIKYKKLSLLKIYRNFVGQKLLLSFRQNNKNINDSNFLILLTLVIIIVLGVTTYSILSIGVVPLLILIQTNDHGASLYARSSSFRQSSSFISLIFAFFNASSWLSYLLFSILQYKKHSIISLLFWICFVFSCLLCIVDTKIMKIIFYLLSFIILKSLLDKKSERSKSKFLFGFNFSDFLILAVICFLLPIFFIFFKGHSGSIIEILYEEVIQRICLGQLAGTYVAKEIFPDLHPFIYFSSTGKILNVFMGEQTNPSYGVLTMSFYDPIGVANGKAGHMTSNYLAEAWSNFGYWGLIISPIYVGAIVQLTNLFFLSKPKTVFSVATYTYISVNLTYSSEFIPFYYPLQLGVTILGFYCFGKILRLI